MNLLTRATGHKYWKLKKIITKIYRSLQGIQVLALLGHKDNEKALHQQFTVKHLAAFPNFLHLSNQEYNWTQWGVESFFKVIWNKINYSIIPYKTKIFLLLIMLKTLSCRRFFWLFSSLYEFTTPSLLCHSTHFSDGKTKYRIIYLLHCSINIIYHDVKNTTPMFIYLHHFYIKHRVTMMSISYIKVISDSAARDIKPYKADKVI